MTLKLHSWPILIESRWLRPWGIVGLVSIIYIVGILALHQGDPMALVNIGTRFDPGLPSGTMGYDGQFNYQIARDPLEGWLHVDQPAYRYQRILYPALARLFSLGSPGLLPWSLVVINLIAVSLGTALTEKLLLTCGANPWYALVYGLNIGMLMSIRLDLNEPLAFLLLQFGALLWLQDKPHASAAAFGLAALAKEVTLILSVGYILYTFLSKKWKPGLVWSGLVIGPFLFWQVGLRVIFGTWGVRSGGALATPFELIPLHGWWGMASLNRSAFLFMSILVLPMAILPALAALRMSLRDLWKRYHHPALYSLLLQSAVFLFLPMSNILDPLGLSRFTIGLIVALLAYGAHRGSRRVLLYTQFWMITLVFLLQDSFLPL
jgi:hypothetical protein